MGRLLLSSQLNETQLLNPFLGPGFHSIVQVAPLHIWDARQSNRMSVLLTASLGCAIKGCSKPFLHQQIQVPMS